MRNFFIELNIYYKICIFIKFFNNKNKNININKIKIINKKYLLKDKFLVKKKKENKKFT